MSPRYLAGSVDLPYVTKAGRVVTKPGYDEETKLYLHMPRGEEVFVPDSPTRDQVRAALAEMMAPWREYRFADEHSAAGMVSAVIAAVERPLFAVCPAWLFEGCQQASGKTQAASSVGAVSEGDRPGVTAFSGSGPGADDELRKRLMAEARGGVRFVCIDNIIGHFKSSALSSVLTSGKLQDRILGRSQSISVDVRSLVTLTGNNASMDADLQRRTVQVRIDAGVNPSHRVFAFSPVNEALRLRRRIAEAVCTVLRAYFAAGAPVVVAGDAGGFGDWNLLCRQVVLWIAREGLAEGVLPWLSLGDPAASMLADPSASDPELESHGDLLIALNALSEGRPFTAAEAHKWHAAGAHDADSVSGQFRSAVIECTGKVDLSVKGLGRTFRYRRDRVVGGLKLLMCSPEGARMCLWRVVQVG